MVQMPSLLFDAHTLQERIDSAARDLVAANQLSGVSAEAQAFTIQTVRALRDELIHILSQAREELKAEQQRLESKSRNTAALQERLRTEQVRVAEDRKRLDDEMLRQFVSRSDSTIDTETRHLVEEKHRLADERMQLAEERRRMAMVQASGGMEQRRLAEEIRAFSFEQRCFREEWRQHWLQLAQASQELSREKIERQAQTVADERRWLDAERCRLSEEATQLALQQKQLDEEKKCLSEEFSFLLRCRSSDVGLSQFAQDNMQSPRIMPASPSLVKAAPAHLENRYLSKAYGRLDELHEQMIVWHR